MTRTRNGNVIGRLTTVLLVLSLVQFTGVSAFSSTISLPISLPLTSSRRCIASLCAMSTVTQDSSDGILGDKIASLLVASPVYPILKTIAINTMKNSARDVGVDWDGEVGRLKAALDWDAELESLLSESDVETPEYFRRPFHAYADGNLCWEAAWEQNLASKAVWVRNFPKDAANGEYRFRTAYETQMRFLGAVIEDGGVVVDMGCGTGSSTKYLASAFPTASQVLGFDLSPHMVIVGRHVLSEDENADPRVELRYRDAARTGLPSESVSLVSLSLVVHELPGTARREILREASRILQPGGSLSILEMDPSAPGYVKLRKNPVLYSIIRSTEPHMGEYFSQASKIDAELQEAGFSTIRKSGATGRHMTVIASKAGSLDLRGDDDKRNREDTHIQTHTFGAWFEKISLTHQSQEK